MSRFGHNLRSRRGFTLFELLMVMALLAIIITLILRPSGLFGQQKELEERV